MPTTLADHVRLTASFERMFALLRRLNPPQEVSLTAASTLRTLERSGPHRISELAVREDVTQPAMTQVVSRLERDGLALRCPDRADGRVVMVQITAGGRDLLRRRRSARAEKLFDLTARLDPAEREAIMAALPALYRLADLLSQ